MKRECLRYEELIWDQARDDAALPEDVVLHIQECESCARVCREAQRGLKLLKCAAAYPEAPDCRAAVAARISRIPGRAPAGRFGWAWAGAAAILVLAAFVPGLFRVSPAPVKHLGSAGNAPALRSDVARAPLADTAADVVEAPSSGPAPVQKEPAPTGTAPLRAPRARHVLGKARVVASRVREASTDPVESASSRVNPVCAEPGSRVSPVFEEEPGVTVVSVEWSAQPSDGDLSYSFVEEDEAGETATRGVVVRTGNSIEIHMETTPVAAAAPLRGGIDRESNPAG